MWESASQSSQHRGSKASQHAASQSVPAGHAGHPGHAPDAQAEASPLASLRGRGGALEGAHALELFGHHAGGAASAALQHPPATTPAPAIKPHELPAQSETPAQPGMYISPDQIDAQARALRAAFGMFSCDGQAVVRVLNQHPEMVRAICRHYDARYSITGSGLVADLKKHLGPPLLEVASALLQRAELTSLQSPATFVRQTESARARTHHRITASPAAPVAVPGTQIRYAVCREAEVNAASSYYSYQWLCLNDPQTCQARGAPEIVWGPSHATSWDTKWSFTGNHRVLCRVQYHEKESGLLGAEIAHAPEYIEYQQAVHAHGDVLARSLDHVAPHTSAAEQLARLQAYEQTLLGAAEQEGSQPLDPKVRAALTEQTTRLRDKLRSTEGQVRHPLKAVHVTTASAQVSVLNLFIARTEAAPGQESWQIVDITNPTDRRLTGEYTGHGPDAQQAIEAALSKWDRDNRYPKGRLRVQIPASTGAPLLREFQTDGASFWDSVAEFFQQVGFWAGVGALGAAVLLSVAPEPAVSKAAAALLWTSLLANTGGAVTSIAQRHAEGMSSVTDDAFDALTIASSILGARWALGATVKGLSLAGSRMGTAVVIGRIGTDAAQGVLLSVKYVQEYAEILNERDPKRRTDRLLALLGQAALSGGLLVLSLHGSGKDLSHLRGQKEALARLGNSGETIDLSASPAQAESAQQSTQSAQPESASQAHADAHVQSEPAATPARVTEPVPGLFDSIDATPNQAPPGWTFHDNITSLSPGNVLVETVVIGPNAQEGRIRRIFSSGPEGNKMTMDLAFLDKLPGWVKAGVPLRADKGIPTVTYLTLRQMKLAQGRYGELNAVKMSSIQNIESLMQLKVYMDSGMTLKQALIRTHSVEYASTAIQQSGHVIKAIDIDFKGSWKEQIGWLMEKREFDCKNNRPNYKVIEEHEKLLTKYNMKRTDELLMNYDIYMELVQHSQAR